MTSINTDNTFNENMKLVTSIFDDEYAPHVYEQLELITCELVEEELYSNKQPIIASTRNNNIVRASIYMLGLLSSKAETRLPGMHKDISIFSRVSWKIRLKKIAHKDEYCNKKASSAVMLLLRNFFGR
ncbi:hypothetical protein BCU71_19095 [Vibrio lentus]|uniref:hypothetical protein n=1 Tax=Vibrio lentus TaxID=136468 RepID=UPI000C86508F|nr:hypothetical protein [Vibrio lentus]PMH28847.1 hypothetical protein BCU71_19095 [Vibrio lentus]PMK68490.1 hypothetical protein BCT93_18635 [Vibrio lentus]